MVVVTAFILLTNIISHISSAQREYVLELLSSNSAKSWSQCNTLCGQLYGTELATIISQEDRANLVSYAQSAGQYLWIGLTDQQSEGNWKWMDGTPCTIANGDCSEFWTTTPNNVGDVRGGSNADCGFWDTIFDTLGEANCVETTIYDGGYLCNANACNIVIDGASECTITSNCASNQRCNDRSNTGTLISLTGSARCGTYCTCYCLDIPTTEPTSNPTSNPSAFPSSAPTLNPSSNPSIHPTKNPTKVPTTNPTKNPTFVPTQNSTKRPTKVPTKMPIKVPTISKDDHVGMAMDGTSSTTINVAPIETNGMNRKSFYLLCAIISAVGIICCVMLISMIYGYKLMTIKKNVRRAEAVIGLTQTSASPSIVSAAKKNKQQNIETILMKTNQVSKEGVNTTDMNTLDMMGKNDDGTAVDNDSDSDSDGLFAPQFVIKTTRDTTQ